MHWPGRLRISWENENTLKLETDTGQQTRLFNFGNSRSSRRDPVSRRGRGSRSPRGNCPAAAVADAAVVPVPRAVPRRPGSSMRVTTTRMRPGYYRRNGVPYGANATMTEWFTTITEPDGNTYLLVTKILEDAQYLNAPYVRTVQFKKENGTAGWNPTPCVAQ